MGHKDHTPEKGAADGIATLDGSILVPTTQLPVMVGDTGSGGVKGAVPAPASGDATKFLRGDGTFAAAGVGGSNALPFSWAQIQTTSGTYLAVGAFVFHGTATLGVPTAITLVAGMAQAAMSGSFRVQDLTNALTIAEITGNTDLYPSIIDMGTLSNLSAGQAIWEFQIKRDTGNGSAKKVIASALSVLLP